MPNAAAAFPIPDKPSKASIPNNGTPGENTARRRARRPFASSPARLRRMLQNARPATKAAHTIDVSRPGMIFGYMSGKSSPQSACFNTGSVSMPATPTGMSNAASRQNGRHLRPVNPLTIRRVDTCRGVQELNMRTTIQTMGPPQSPNQVSCQRTPNHDSMARLARSYSPWPVR